MVVELREELTDGVLLGRIVVVVVHAMLVIFFFTTMVTIFKFSIPQTLDLVNLLGAEGAPCLKLKLLVAVNHSFIIFCVTLLLFLLSQISKFESDLRDLTHVHILCCIARWVSESCRAF